MSAELTYRRDIDGLRAIAVGSVVLFHAGVPPFRGGFVGVDVFFVISGYLITTIIAREAAERRFTVTGFYVRRVRRIFPALFAMLAATAAVGAVLMTPPDYGEFGESVAATALFVSNLFFWLKSGYFDPAADLKPLLHTWSLAVEEQFYLFFPLLMAVLAVRVKRWRGVLAGLAAASFALSLWQVARSPAAAFYSPLGRAWELLAGGLVAVGAVPPLRPRWLREAAAALGAGLVLFAIFAVTPQTPFPGAAALAPCLGAALLIHAGAREPTVVGRALSVRPAVGLGLVSYSLYLWHWPVLVFVRYVLMRPLTPVDMAGAIAAGLGLAVFSWRFVERPFRRGTASRAQLFGAALALMAAAAAFGAVNFVTRGLPQRLSPAALAYARAADDTNPERRACDSVSVARLQHGHACAVGAPGAAAPTFAVFGDSFGDAFMPAVAVAAREHGRKGLALTYSGCVSLPDVRQPGGLDCRAFLNAAIALIRRTPSIDRIVVIDRWTTAVDGTRFGSWEGGGFFLADPQTRRPGYDENPRVVSRGLERLARALAPRRVFVVEGFAEQRVDAPRAAALAVRFGWPLPTGVTRAAYDARQRHTRGVIQAAAARAGATVLDAAPYVCGSRACPAVAGAAVLYADDNHLSATGARRARGVLDAAFAPTLKPRL